MVDPKGAKKQGNRVARTDRCRGSNGTFVFEQRPHFFLRTAVALSDYPVVHIWLERGEKPKNGAFCDDFDISGDQSLVANDDLVFAPRILGADRSAGIDSLVEPKYAPFLSLLEFPGSIGNLGNNCNDRTLLPILPATDQQVRQLHFSRFMGCDFCGIALTLPREERTVPPSGTPSAGNTHSFLFSLFDTCLYNIIIGQSRSYYPSR